MSQARHRRAHTSLLQGPSVRRAALFAVPTLVCSALVAGAVAQAGDSPGELAAADMSTSMTVSELRDLRGLDRASRSLLTRRDVPRSLTAAEAAPARPVAKPSPKAKATPKPKAAPKPKATPKPAPEPTVVAFRYATTALKVREEPSRAADVLDVLDEADRIGITGRTEGAFAQVVYGDDAAWVGEDFLARTKPEPEPEPEPASTDSSSDSDSADSDSDSADSDGDGDGGGGISGAPCPSGSGVESGLSSNAIAVHRAVCANFPSIGSYGGLGAGEMHSSGRALDIMVSGSLGSSVADWVRANAGALGVSEVIYAQRIWTVQRSGDGWRGMSDRGSATANHYDHVHVTVY